MSLPTLQSVFSADQIDALENWISNQVSIQSVVLIDTSNTGTGTDSCTIDGTSGIATFTDFITAGTTTSFTITNSSITTSSCLLFGLQYTGNGSPAILSYARTTGSCTIAIKNTHASASTNANLVVHFQLVS